jgi:hypothetical protein
LAFTVGFLALAAGFAFAEDFLADLAGDFFDDFAIHSSFVKGLKKDAQKYRVVPKTKNVLGLIPDD